MTIPIQLVFDTNILADTLLARGHYYKCAVQLLDRVANKEVEGWYAPHSLTTVYYLVERSLAVGAENRAKSETRARKLVQSLVKVLKPLPQVGNEILDIISQPGDDYEDEVIVYLATEYLSNPLIVTRDKWFLQSSKPHSAHPQEIIENGFSTWLPAEQKIDFMKLATQQRELRPNIQRNIHRVLAHGQYIMGPEVKELEQKLVDYVGVKHCVTAGSGTDALLIAMMALGIEPGDEIITTPFTFIATAETIALMHAKPVFVDIESDTFNIDAAKIEAAITEKTKAIMPVSLYGQPADMAAIQEIANRHGLKVIIDGAQSFGSTYKGKTDSQLGDISTTSFFPAKPLGCYGDGGAVFTNNDDYAEKMKMIRVHGQNKRYHHKYIGMGGRLDTMQAAILLAKLPKYAEEIKLRQEVAEQYTSALKEKVVTPDVKEERTSVWAQYTVRVQDREHLQSKLKEASVPTAVHYPMPLHRQECFQYLGLRKGDLPIAEKAAQEVMSLPMNPFLTDTEVKYVTDALKTSV